LPLEPKNNDEDFENEKFEEILADKELADLLRYFFLVLSTHGKITCSDFSIPPEVGTHAQTAFCDQRKKEDTESGKVETSEDAFHHWLTLARYMCCSKGKLNLTTEIFDAAKEVEDARRARCKAAMPEKAEDKK